MKIMKKLAYLSVLAGLFLTGCIAGDYGIEPAGPQVNEQDEIVNLAGAVAVTEVAPIDLAAVEGETVSVATVSATGLDGEGVELIYKIVFDGEYEFTVKSDMALSVKDLQAMVEDAFGKRPVARTFEAMVTVYAIVNGTAMIFESEEFEVVITPEAPVIENGYYLVGDMCAWNKEGAMAFSHSGKDVYEDPVFTITFSTSKDNSYWKIIPKSNYEGDFWGAGVLGTAVDGDPALEGKLVTENPQAGKIEATGMYMMTINMMDYTYSIKALAPEYYILGDAPFAWNVNDKKYLMYPESPTVMTYTTKFNGNLKFINGNDVGTDNWDACYGTAKDGDTALSGTLQQKAGAIHSPAEGYYTFKADIAAMTYTWTKVDAPVEYTSMAAVGGFQGWNPANPDTQMTKLTPHNWYIKDLNISTDEFKIAANGKWDDSWGELNMAENNFGTLASGGNCKVVPGVYDVYFNDITKQCVIVKK